MDKLCVRCGKAIPPEEHRTKYCSDACSDSAQRAVIKARKAQLGLRGGQARLLYRRYDYREPQA